MKAKPYMAKKVSKKAEIQKRVALKTAEDIRKFMARCVRLAFRGEGGAGEVNEYYKLVNMASQLLRAVEVADLDKRLETLEDQIGGLRG